MVEMVPTKDTHDGSHRRSDGKGWTNHQHGKPKRALSRLINNPLKE